MFFFLAAVDAIDHHGYLLVPATDAVMEEDSLVSGCARELKQTRPSVETVLPWLAPSVLWTNMGRCLSPERDSETLPMKRCMNCMKHFRGFCKAYPVRGLFFPPGELRGWYPSPAEEQLYFCRFVIESCAKYVRGWSKSDTWCIDNRAHSAAPRDRKSTRLNSSHAIPSRMPSSA